MIRIKALNESSSTSDDECEEAEKTLLTREAQEEHLQSNYFQALKLIDTDKEEAKKELKSLLNHLNGLNKETCLTNIENLKYLTLKNLGLISTNNLDYLLDALSIDGGDVTLWIETGRRALYQFINLPLARACFEKSQRLSPTNWIVADTLIGIYFMLNDSHNCLNMCLKALTKDPNYFKAQLLISEMIKKFPPIKQEIPKKYSYLLDWRPSKKDAERGDKILKEYWQLKEKRKRKFDEDQENQISKKRKFSLNLETPSPSLLSLGNALRKIYSEIVKEKYSLATLVTIEFEAGSTDDISSTEESASDDNMERDKAPKHDKRLAFPFEFIDKRRSTRVQRIQSKSSDPSDLSSDNIFDKIYSMIPQCIMSREAKFKEPEIAEIPKTNENQAENCIVNKFLSRQKGFRKQGKRIDQLIGDLLLEITNQASYIKLPSYFIELYKLYRQVNRLPFPLTCQIGRDITLDELKLILTANEADYNQNEAAFLTQMLPHLETYLELSEYDQFLIRLIVLRGDKESQIGYLMKAQEILSTRVVKAVYSSNRKVYNASALKSMINTLNENNLDKLLSQHRHEELVELLASKPELSDSEERYLCEAIKSTENWQRGVEIISANKNLSERYLRLLRTCLRNGIDLKIDRELAKRLLKLGTEKYSVMSWVCILYTFVNESSDESDEKKIIDLINTVHQFLGKRGACTNANGEFLLLALDFLINQCSKTKDNLILQCFACLYNHPPRKSGCSFLQVHSNAPQVDLKWDNVDIIYSYFIPEELPEFDSLKRVSIDSETEILLCKIVPLIPDYLNPEKDAKLVNEYLKTGKPMPLQTTTPKHHVTQNLYYFLADYYFKNKEFQKARDFYVLDLALNRDRFDSWAACALSITHLIEQYFSRGDDIFYTASDKVIRLVDSSFRCYSEALRLVPNNTKILIEYGNLAYNVASYLSRVKRTRPLIDGPEKERLIKQQKRMLHRAKICFEAANNADVSDEVWLHYYFLGKIAERSNILEALRYYELSDIHLAISGATYPRKIGYHNPTRLSIEALEIHYRIHAAVLKYIRRNSGKISSKTLTQIKLHLLRALRSSFAKQAQHSSPTVPDHDYLIHFSDSSGAMDRQILDDVKEVTNDLLTMVEDGVAEGDEKKLRPSIMEMCLEAMNRCLQRFPNHYKSLHRMAYHFCSLKDFAAARIVLLGRFTTSSGTKSLLRKAETTTSEGSNGQEAAKAEPIIGLFGEHKNNNLFNGIWRIPIDDIDRPGSFATHMYRSTQLLIKVSWALSDLHRLSTIAVQLSKTPEAGKKFLRDIDREHLAKDALRRCFNILRSRIEESRLNRNQLEQVNSDLRKVAEKLMKCSAYQRETSHFVGECEHLIRTIQSS